MHTRAKARGRVVPCDDGSWTAFYVIDGVQWAARCDTLPMALDTLHEMIG